VTIATPGVGDEVANSKDVERPFYALLRLAAAARLCRSGDGELHAQVPIGDRYEVYGVRSGGFRDWLIDGYFADRRESPSPATIARVVGLLEARARFDGGAPSVFIRVAGDVSGAANFLDLGEPSGRAVKISAEGWGLVDRPAIPFQRPTGMLPLPVPSRGGSIELCPLGRSGGARARPGTRLVHGRIREEQARSDRDCARKLAVGEHAPETRPDNPELGMQPDRTFRDAHHQGGPTGCGVSRVAEIHTEIHE
jgi:hypothetical protein